MANIMIVEDEGIVARDIRNRLTKMGYDIAAVVDTGEAALEKATHLNLDLVLMDIMLKGELDGTQTANQLYHTHHLPVVYLTAHADQATVQRAKETQPFGYVIKPFQEQDLKTSIEMALAKHQSEERLRQSASVLQENNDVLEARVAARTSELQEAVHALQLEIAERKRAQETLEERDIQLRQSQKMEAVGRLAGGVAHDFNNQLAIMRGYLDLAIDNLDKGLSVTRYLQHINGAVDRASGLTRQLLLFTSHQPVHFKVINLNDQINHFQDMLRRLLPEDIALEVQLAPNLGSVRADAVNIDQVVTNLVVNARDAMPKGGHLTIQTHNVILSESERAERGGGEGSGGQFVHLMVEDTGTGMDEAVRDKIFEPFFTTKPVGEGTGLGLSVVYGIVQAHGGWIFADSTLGKGSQFHVFLPMCESDEDTPQDLDIQQTTDNMGSGQHIVVVDDDEHIRNMLVVILEQHGYRVHACGSQKEAHLILQNDVPIDLILTDVILSDGRGTELAVDIQKSHPHLPLILMTGYPGTHIDLTRIQSIGLQLIQKPIARQDLLDLIYQALTD